MRITVSHIVKRMMGRKRDIRNVAQQRFARRSLCFGYFCTLRDMKVRLCSFRVSLSGLMPRPFDTLVILCANIFSY